MNKRTLAATIGAAVTLPLAANADIYDARSLARGGTGLTMGEYNQALYNPALLSTFDENDDFSFALNAGVLASDQHEMVNELDDVDDRISELEDNPPLPGPDRQRAVDGAEDSLMSLSDKQLQLDVGGALLVGIPNRFMPAAFMSRTKASAGVGTTYHSSDRQVLEDIADDLADEDDLQSTADASLVWVEEYGLMGGRTFDVQGFSLVTGATLKFQTVELIQYSETPSAFEADDMTDSDNLSSHSEINLDLGAMTRFGDNNQYIAAATVENLIPKTFSGPKDTDYKMAPVVTAAIGYQPRTWFKAEANLDLTQRNGYELLDDTQFLRIGAELSAGRHLHLRAGYRADIQDNVSSLVTLGLGITPFDRINIDLSFATGDGETLGGALQIGFKI